MKWVAQVWLSATGVGLPIGAAIAALGLATTGTDPVTVSGFTAAGAGLLVLGTLNAAALDAIRPGD